MAQVRKRVHLYPTKRVKKVLKKTNPDELNQKLTSLFQEKKLTVEEDTTIYFPRKYANSKILKVNAQNNTIFREGDPLDTKKYMFVFSQEKRLFATQKQLKTQFGRFHHSSLVQGKPVLAAGNIKIQSSSNGSQQISMNNQSGHYKPTPDSIDQVLQWLTNEGLEFQIIGDRLKEIKSQQIRTVKLMTISSKNS